MRKVSVVVPCYNAGGYLDKCIEQLLHQTIGLEHMEIILVDDASADGGKTRNLIAEYERRYPDTIMAVFLEENLRQGGARNVGVSYAGGEYLCFCDADDWLMEETLERCYQAAIEYDADVVEFAMALVRDREGSVTPKKGDQNRLLILNTEAERKKFLVDVNDRLTYGSQQKFYRLSLIRDNHITFAEHLIFEEASFVVPARLYEKRHYYLDEQLYVCYLSPGSTMRGRWQTEHRWDNIRVWLSLMADLSARGLLKRHYPELEYQFWRYGLGWNLRELLRTGCVLVREELKLCADVTLGMFPNIRNNIYLKIAAMPWDLVLLDLLDMELTDEQVRLVNQSLREYM